MPDDVLDLSPLIQFVNQLQVAGKTYQRHAVAALNDSALYGQTQAVDGIASQIALPKAYIRRAFRINKARQASPVARISVAPSPVNLADYKYTQLLTPTKDPRAKRAVKPNGLQSLIHRRKGAAVLQHVFLITGQNSGKVIAVTRKHPNQKGDRSVRTVYGPSVYQLWRDERQNVASGDLPDYLVKRFIERAGL